MTPPTSSQRHCPVELVEHLLDVLVRGINHGHARIEIDCSSEGENLRSVIIRYGEFERFRIDKTHFRAFGKCLIDALTERESGN